VLPLLLVLFIVVPIAELAVIIQIGQAIGVLPTIALLIVDSVLGTLLMRAQGRAAWRRFSEAVQTGRPPAREVLDGALVLLGGALLLTPGFLTDILGLALLLPPSRAVVRGVLARRLLRRMTSSLTSAAAGAGAPGSTRRRPGGPADVEGTAVDVDAPELPRR
jgi:UPF0716 protein FxsA